MTVEARSFPHGCQHPEPPAHIEDPEVTSPKLNRAAFATTIRLTLNSHANARAGGRQGRPRKFSRPSCAVTLTLPEDVVAALKAVDRDLSRAVVRVVQTLMVAQSPPAAAKVTTLGDRGALILLPPSRWLREFAGVELITLSDGRALLSFDEGMSIADFELSLRDAVADDILQQDDRAMLQELATILRDARRSDGVVLKRRSIVILRSNGRSTTGNGAR